MSLVFPSCDTCQGSGWANPGYPAAGSCDDCGGRGWVIPDEAVEAIKPFIHVSSVFNFATENERWKQEQERQARRAIAEFLRVIEEGPE